MWRNYYIHLLNIFLAILFQSSLSNAVSTIRNYMNDYLSLFCFSNQSLLYS